jgi:hypothetical protein
MELGLAKWLNIKWPLDEKSARGCLLVNLAFWPGLGSVLARRKSGWVQMAMAMGGLFTLFFALQQFMAMLMEETREPRWSDHFVWEAIIGVGLFAVAWIWGLFTGLSIRARVGQPPKLPPVPPPMKK